MARLHVLAATSSAPLAEGGVRASFSLAIPFGAWPWWYDVHRVEGAV